MLNLLGGLIQEAIQKQIAQAQQQQALGNPPGVPAPQAGPPAGPRPPQMGTPAPVRPAPVAAPAVPMGRMPDALPYNSLPPLDSLAAPAGLPVPPNPLLDALRGGQALIGGIVVAQVLGPPAALRPHRAPGDTL